MSNGTSFDLSAIRTDQTSYKWTFRALIGVYSTAEVDDLIAGVGGGSVVWGDIGGTLANQTDLRNALNSKQPGDDTLTALAGVTTAADQVIYATGVDTFSVTALSAFGRSLIDDASASAARTTLGLGDIATLAASAKQDSDATLTAFAGLTITADKLPYGNGSDTFATTDLTAFGRSLIDDADASTARTTLGLGTIATLASSVKQDTLVSGTSIKTVNSTSLLGSGDVSVGTIGGSTGATDNRVVRVDGTGGSTIQGSAVTIDDSGNVSGVGSLTVDSFGTGDSALIIETFTDPANTSVKAARLRTASSTRRLYIGNSGSAFYSVNFSGVSTVESFPQVTSNITCTSGNIAASSGSVSASTFMQTGVYTFATVPSASANTGKFIRISDRAQKHAYSDGTNWRFFGDDAIIS